MTALQTINLGTAPGGVDGDPVRTAFTKVNSNVAILTSQAALTSATTITASQALTAAHIGKRVNFNSSSAITVNLPAASTCAADQVTLLRNIGTGVVKFAITSGSGDTVALSQLNPGESALMDVDGVHKWSALLRGRTNSDSEYVNGDLAVTGNVLGSNPANLFPNGTGELGDSTWLTHFFAVRQDSANGGTKYGNHDPINGGSTVSDTSLPFPLFPGPLCLQAEIFTTSLPAGSNVWVILDTLDSSGNVVTSAALQVGVSGNTSGFTRVSGTANLSGTFTQGQIRLLANPSVVAGVAGVQFRHIKLSAGTTPSLYSQEASTAYLNTLTTGRLLNTRVLTGSGSYTPSSSAVTSIMVEIQGGGAGSAGLVANNSAQAGISGSGATGGYVKHRYTSGFSGLAYSVGAGGAAGPVGNGTGGNGGNTTFGSLVAGGGQGSGTVQTVGSTAAGSGAPGTAAGGNLINAPGVASVSGWIIISAGMIVPTPSNPSTYFGLYSGWGAPGRGSGGNASAIAGLPGGVGTIIVYEYA